MIINAPVGKISEEKYSGLKADYLDIEWYSAHKKIDRKITQGGIEVGIRMNHETMHRGWQQDDVIYADSEKLIAINIVPCKCISVKVTEIAKIVKFCYEVGNRHAPFFYGEDENEFLTPYEAPMKAMIEKLGLTTEKKEARLSSDKRISSAQGHSHSH